MRPNPYAWLDGAAVIASSIMILVVAVTSWLALSGRVRRMSMTPEAASIVFLLANAVGWPAIFWTFVLGAASTINSFGREDPSTLYRGSVWNGDAALGAVFIGAGLFAAGVAADVVFAIHVARIRLRQPKH